MSRHVVVRKTPTRTDRQHSRDTYMYYTQGRYCDSYPECNRPGLSPLRRAARDDAPRHEKRTPPLRRTHTCPAPIPLQEDSERMSTIVQGLPVYSVIDEAPSAGTNAPPPGPNNEEALCRAMAGLGFPLGLAKELIESTVVFPVRFWVVDNSGSMNMNDGTRLVPNSAGRLMPVKTSRWTELSDTIMAIAELASTLGARTDFHLLNATSQGQCLSIGGECSDVACVAQPVTLPELKRRFGKISPSGGTPLTEAVMQVPGLQLTDQLGALS